MAGGLGTRISEETGTKPKPMVLIDDKPILWHVMNIYAQQGFRDFVIATGYKHEVIESWIDTLEESWNVESLFTGLETQTGGRIKRCMDAHRSDRYFITYGDGLANVNLKNLLLHHLKMKCTMTVTAVRPPARFGVLQVSDGIVSHFGEKLQTDAGWINGGFFVAESTLYERIEGDFTLLETGPLPELAQAGQLAAFLHEGFWQPMDTLRERNLLSEFAKAEAPPWFSQF